MSQKTTSKTAKKSSAGSTTAKKSTAKKATSNKMTMAEMQKSLKSLETRMKRADTLTRKSVTTLEEVVDTLDARTKRDRADHRSALSRRVSQLSSSFEESMTATRQEIKSTLSNALAEQNIPILQNSITGALSSLDRLETQQAQSIAKINRHLANLAKAVEDRIIKDQIEATEALRRVETRLSVRLDSIETDTAQAISTIGEKVETLNNAMEKRNHKVEKLVAQKISDLTEETQARFDKQTNSIQERLEKLEVAEREASLMRPDSLTESMSSHVSALAGQVETLKTRLATIDASFNVLRNQTQQMGQDIRQLRSPLKPQASGNILSFAGTERATPPTPTSSGTRQAQQNNTSTFTNNPYGTPNPAPVNAPLALTADVNIESTPHARLNTEEHKPIEFDPHLLNSQAATALAPQTYQPPQTLEETLPPPPLETLAPDTIPQQAPSQLQEYVPQISTPSLKGLDVETLPVGDPQLPYADPAYAENEEYVDQMRIGEDTSKKSKRRSKKRSKSAKNNPPVEFSPDLLDPVIQANNIPDSSDTRKTGRATRNLRVGALATGLTLVGLFAIKTFMDEPASFNDANFSTNSTNAQPGDASQTINSPIGVYADNASPAVTPDQASDLEVAASNGNAIAEYQLGITYMEQGRTEEGLALIRNASATMPAAQYRLAKLYETGTAVEKDTTLARELTERAARAGNRIAMHDLAIYYAYGNGDVDVDMNMAAGWFTKAAERGVVDSQFNLAILYENGQGVVPSAADAYFWYSIAASQGDQSANARIAALETVLSPEDIAAAKTRIDNFQLVKINPAVNGIFNDLPWAKTNTLSAERQRIQNVQTILGNIGFDAGTADGIMGNRTRQAIKDFERINGMAETGQISDALLDRLSVASGA